MGDIAPFRPLQKSLTDLAAANQYAVEHAVTALSAIQTPMTPCRTSAGLEAKIPLGPLGGVITEDGVAGTPDDIFGRNAMVALDVFEEVCTLTLAIDEEYVCAEFSGAHQFPAEWSIQLIDNAVDTEEIIAFDTNAGAPSYMHAPKNLNFSTSGFTGPVTLELRCKQHNGPTGLDAKGFLAIVEKA